MIKQFKRWAVEYEDENDSSIVHLCSFNEDEYEDAVILAKQTGINQIIDRIEMVRIDL